MLDDIPEYMKGEPATPVVYHFFDILEEATKLFWTNADLFLHFVAQPLYLLKRARLDIQPTVSLLCTMVRDNNTGNCKNIEKVMKYIEGNIDVPLILSIEKCTIHV